jgi:hypothetical protein
VGKNPANQQQGHANHQRQFDSSERLRFAHHVLFHKASKKKSTTIRGGTQGDNGALKKEGARDRILRLFGRAALRCPRIQGW